MKKNIKKLAAILLAVVMTISALSLSAFATEDVLTENGIVSEDETVSTTGAAEDVLTENGPASEDETVSTTGAAEDVLTENGPASEEDVLTENGSVSKDEAAKTTGYDNTYAAMNVVVTWGDLDFEYYFGEIWNPTTLQYDAAEGKTIGWNKDSTTVTVTNRSSIAVDVDVLFNKNASNSAYRDVSGSFDKTRAILGSAIDGTAKSDDFTLSIAGIPNEASTSKTILGTIKVTISGRYSSGGSMDGDDNDG